MEVIFKWIGGATFILTIGDLKIGVDPVLCKTGTVQDYFWFKSRRIEDPVYSEKDFENVGLWLITHNHEDHIDDSGISKISEGSKIITNQNSSKILQKNGKKDLTILDWNQSKEFNINGYQIRIEAIPAIHGINPLSALFSGKGNGYYLTVSKGENRIRIYITGDTVYKNKIIRSLKNKEIGLMIPNMGAVKQGTWIMTLTLSSKMLKQMIDKLNPKVVIPVHYGTFEHYKETVTDIEEIKDKRLRIIKTGVSTEIEII